MIELLIKDKYLEWFTYVPPIPPNEDIIPADGVTFHKSPFDDTHNGGMLDFEIPEDCDAVILMGNKGGGYAPLQCLLPHQVYGKNLREMAEKERWEVFYIIGIKYSDIFPVAYNGDYGKKRWEKK
jgi:hypothetical protein